MKILFLVSSLDSGGAERVITHLANFFAQKGEEVTVATFANTDPFYPLHPGVEHVKLDLLRPSKGLRETFINGFTRLYRLYRLFKERDPKIVISFMTQTNLLAIMAAKMARKPIIVSERIAYDAASFWIRVLRRLLYPFADALVVQTKADGANYLFVPKVWAIPNPLVHSCKEAGWRERLVLAVGRLDRQKGFDGLIEAFCAIKTKGWRLVIAGEGEERTRLEELIQKRGAGNVELIGRQKDIFSWYGRAALFVLSSKREGFPNVLIEAMGCGCAPIAFDCPYGPGEIIEDGVNGILVENQNLKALKEAMERLMEDEKLRKRLAAKARKAREEYGIEKVGAQWEELIQKSLS